jgi:hypothetical protein
MSTCTYKYNVGDTIKFKDKFHPTASCGLAELAGTTAKVIARQDYDGPAYKLEGHEGFFTEKCFAGLSYEPEFHSWELADDGVATQQPSDSLSDTEASGASTDTAEWLTGHGTAEGPDYICSACNYSALNDYRGRSTASKFCPRCGKYMTNHQQPED